MNSNAPASSRPRVLLISALVGAGHVQAAKAIQEGLRQAAPDVTVEHLDSMEFAPRWFRTYYAGGFSLMMTRLPNLYGFGFWMSDRPHRPGRSVSERLRLWHERRAMSALADAVRQRQPELVVHTHFLAPPMVGGMIQRKEISSRQFVVVTDYDAHRWWYSEEVNHWFIPGPLAEAKLAKWGIDPQTISVGGIPIHPKWTAPLDRAKILAEWNLPADKPIVILTGGTQFTCGPVVQIAQGILAACPQAHLVVLAGRNKQLLGDLSALPEGGKRLSPMGFTDRGHELLAVCSLMVTKPGGITTTECLSKGTPMVLMRPVPGQEGLNARFLSNQGAAVITHRPAEIIDQVMRLLNDPPTLAKMADSARRLHRPATDTIVKKILESLGR